MQILYGRPVAENIKKEIQEMLFELKGKNKTPKIALIRIGENMDDITYEHSLKRNLEMFSIPYDSYVYAQDEDAEVLKKQIEKLNRDDEIDGIMIFRPIHPQIEQFEINETIDWRKDIDCATSYNQGKLFEKKSNLLYPCTPRAVMETLKFYGVDVVSKKCAVVGASQVVGKALAIMLIKEKATVTVCNSKTLDLKSETRNADIVICATGQAKLITKEHLKDNQVVIDIGINFDNGKICGDVDFENIDYDNIKITPVPKGVGVITTLTLIKQLVEKTLKLS